MARLTTSRGSHRTLGTYSATIEKGPLIDRYWLRVVEASTTLRGKLHLDYRTEIRWMSELYPDMPRRSWNRLFTRNNQPISLEEIIATMSTPEALADLPHPLNQQGITWRQDTPPWTWV